MNVKKLVIVCEEKGVAEGAVATSILLFYLITFLYFCITIKSNFVIEGNKRDQNT